MLDNFGVGRVGNSIHADVGSPGELANQEPAARILGLIHLCGSNELCYKTLNGDTVFGRDCLPFQARQDVLKNKG
jgi:hypothetical protein